MKEEEIRPRAIFDEYLRLCAEDTQRYFAAAERTAIQCPACDAPGTPAFEKAGFAYELCAHCDTLYASPRPPASAFAAYYRESPSSRFWSSHFYRETAESRRRLVWLPKAEAVMNVLRERGAGHRVVVDVGAGYGIFAEEIRRLSGCQVVAIEPAPHLAQVCRERSLTVVEKFLEDVCPAELPAHAKLFASFELFEHLHDPALFLARLLRLMERGDLMVLTTLSGTGLDIRLLWEQSKSIFPPHHLNFLNPGSISLLLSRIGFQVLDITTPGQLDLDIVANNLEQVTDRFWRTFLRHADAERLALWQKLLADTGWSSHMMVVAQKPYE